MPASVTSLTAKIAAEGGAPIDLDEPSGERSGDTPLGKVTLGWKIADGTITITIVSKPWLLPASEIWQHIDEVFAN